MKALWPSTDLPPRAKVTVQQAQLDDTFFDYFVQLENASALSHSEIRAGHFAGILDTPAAHGIKFV